MTSEERIDTLEKRVTDLEKKVAEATNGTRISKLVSEEITHFYRSLSNAYDHTQQY